MMDLLKDIKSLIKLEKIHTDNHIFKLHYKVTCFVLIVFSILLTSKQYFGDPIDCKVDAKEKQLIETFCWTHGTYIILSTVGKSNGIMSGLGTQYDVNSGVSPHDARYPQTRTNNTGIVVQKYYQWVCLFFAAQAVFFYIPRCLWKTWEAGRLRLLVKDMSGPLVTSNWNAENKQRIFNYLVCRKYKHNCYALRFAFCELLNFINVILQIFLTDTFLSGYFVYYGLALLGDHDGVNAMTLVFPKLAKCAYQRFGASGTEELVDALCLLPLNVVNEKLFTFLWFWYAALTLLSFYALMYRIWMITSATCRDRLLRARCRYLSQKTSDVIVEHFSFGDMFFLDLLAKNVNPIIYKELLVDIAAAFSEHATAAHGCHDDVTIPI